MSTPTTDAPDLATALRNGAVPLDGGLSTVLALAGHDLSDELWSARLLADDPDAIRAAHLAYYQAGARVAITSSYQVTFDGFARRGLDAAATADLLRRSVRLARSAAAEVPGPTWVAASVGPYGAMLADGSEYRGRYGLSTAALADFHRQRLDVLVAAEPDVLAVETIPDLDEAAAVTSVLAGSGVPFWLSYSIRDGLTCAGQPLEDAFAVVAGVPEAIGVGVNCCDPADVAHAAEVARRVTGKPVVVYPNSGETWDATTRTWRGSTSADAGQVTSWLAAGARMVGGCCQVGPSAIAELAAFLRSAPDPV